MSVRQEKIADEVRDIVAKCFTGGRMSDPRLEEVSITHVHVTADLQLASVFFRTYSAADKDEVKDGLYSAASYLKLQLSKGLKLRRIPELRFFYDESIETGAKIEDQLRKIQEEDS